jgi:hypothetical protein
MNKEKICLAECIHYITWIDKQELAKAIYRQEKLWEWVDNVFSLVNKNWYDIQRTEKSRWQCICILTKENTQLQHAIVLNRWQIELNPYCIDLWDYIPEYFFHLKLEKK